MTKEEAIKLLRQIYPNGVHCWLDSQRIEAIEMAISALSKPSLPPDLDEATENCTYREHAYARESFKEGVEWMAGLGETHEHYVIREIADHDIGPAIVCYPETFEIGDKVVVQIRKK